MKARRRLPKSGNRIPVTVDVSRYDDAPRQEVTVRLADSGAWCWQRRRNEDVEETASGLLAPGMLQHFLRLFHRAQATPDAMPFSRPVRGFWFVRIHAAGSLERFATGPVMAGDDSSFARLDALLQESLHLSDGVFTVG